jgi:predicted transcriptional regulator
MSKKRRIKTEILIAVLEILRKAESLHKTELVYGVPLNYDMNVHRA